IMGDATISSSGDLQIAGSAVDTPEIKDRAVSTAKLGDGSVTRGKMAPWFQPKTVAVPGSFTDGTYSAVIVGHSIGHTNYIASVTPQASLPLVVTYTKGNLIGQDPGEQITVWFKNVSGSTISNFSLSVLVLGLT
ncbi:MAG TPA: hypothetical protein VMF31_03315, partial [Solirubrobacterales bacterium]|nr:hypothetical protein [Solirubrobacterales bacterium]